MLVLEKVEIRKSGDRCWLPLLCDASAATERQH